MEVTVLGLTRRFPRKRAFITGAASGLGRAMALQLAREGWNVWLTDARAEALPAVEEQVRALGGTPHVFPLDVTDRDAWKASHDATLEKTGGIDVLVNNAGVAAGGRFGELPLADWDWLMGINLGGVVNGCETFVHHLRAAKSGHVINIASAAALFPVPSMAAYCSAKAAVKMLSEVLAQELHGTGVGVTVVMPEFFRTDLADRTRGPEVARARKLIQRARYTADEVATAALEGAARQRLHVVFPWYVRVGWLLGRLFPGGALGAVRRGEAMLR